MTAVAARTPAELHDIERVTLVGALLNLLLAIIKIIVGTIGHSHALITDGIHSLSDLASDAVVYFASKHGSRGPDYNHPYGHARVGMGILLCLIGAGIAVDETLRLVETPLAPKPEMWVLAMAVISLVAKEGLYWYTLAVARRTESELLRANVWHHRTDAASSVIVVIAVGGAFAGLAWLDAVGAIGVALLIGWIGWDLSRRSVCELVDTGLDWREVAAIRRAIMSVDGVRALHTLRTRRMGGKALVDVHLLLQNPRISVSEGHQISEVVLGKLVKSIDSVTDVTVHIDPEDDETLALNGRSRYARPCLHGLNDAGRPSRPLAPFRTSICTTWMVRSTWK